MSSEIVKRLENTVCGVGGSCDKCFHAIRVLGKCTEEQVYEIGVLCLSCFRVWTLDKDKLEDDDIEADKDDGANKDDGV